MESGEGRAAAEESGGEAQQGSDRRRDVVSKNGWHHFTVGVLVDSVCFVFCVHQYK